jgi:hypothetical protein
MKKLKKQKPLSQSLLSLQFTASPHLSAAPSPSKEEGRSIKIHAKEEEGETPERKKEEKTPLFLSFSLSFFTSTTRAPCSRSSPRRPAATRPTPGAPGSPGTAACP